MEKAPLNVSAMASRLYRVENFPNANAASGVTTERDFELVSRYYCRNRSILRSILNFLLWAILLRTSVAS